MKRTAIFFSVALFTSVLSGQTTLVTEGTVTNSTVTGDWGGVNIPRSVATAFTYRNNSITSVNVSGYMLQAGDEVVAGTNNNLDGEIITGNKLTWNGTDMTSITHGIFTGHNKDVIIEYNYLNHVPMGIIRKSTNDMTNSSGGVAYNLIVSPAVGVVVKGMSDVNIYNNTFYQTRTYAQTNRGLIDVYSNTDVSPSSYAHGTKIKNNIFYTKYQTTNIRVLDNDCLTGFECDYNLYWCEAGSPTFDVNGSIITFAQWQALGYDTHSEVINPNFTNFTDLTPAARLDYGTDLGAAWQTGLSATAGWITGSSPSTANQNGTWQVGARIINAVPQPPLSVTMTISSSHIHKILNIQLAYSSAPTMSLSPEVIKISDISGNLYIEKLLVVGVLNIVIPLNLSAGIYNVQILAAGVEIASKRVMIY